MADAGVIAPDPSDERTVRALAPLMFMVFAMTTDSAGAIMPRIIETYRLGLSEAGAFHYASMGGIAISALGLGFLADRLGRKRAIAMGLATFAAVSLLIPTARSFPLLLALLFVSGLSIGVFKTAALALIGDLTASARAHTSMMNVVEGFFALGAISGPALITILLSSGASWIWLYLAAGLAAAGLAALALVVRFPAASSPRPRGISWRRTAMLAREPRALLFGAAMMLYVGVETAIYVWMPTLFASFSHVGPPFAALALSVFFVLRAAGRFLASWLLTRTRWTAVLALCSLGVLVCFGLADAAGSKVAVILLPASGLFMSAIYPTLNSKAISGFAGSEQGAAAGFMLFGTCVSAVLSPLMMGTLSEAFSDLRAGFILATVFAGVLFLGLAWKHARDTVQTDRNARLPIVAE